MFIKKVHEKQNEIKTIEDYRKASDSILFADKYQSFIMDKLWANKTDEEINNHLKQAKQEGYTMYDCPLVDRKPIISNEADDHIYSLLENFLYSYSEYSGIEEENVVTFIKGLTSYFNITK